MRKIILSIKPFYARKIFIWDKKVELRKNVGRQFLPGNFIYVYSSSPVKEITGIARISQVQKLLVDDIRSKFLSDACITEEDFDSYYEGYNKGVLIWLDNVTEFRKGIPLSVLVSAGFNPPQSYCYLSDNVKRLLGEYQ